MPETSSSNLITKEIGGNWLVNDHLKICILKLNCPTTNEWENDSSRIGNLSMVTQLLEPVGELQQSFLAKEFLENPVLVLAPELAFGTSDFNSLDTLIKGSSQNLIFICGFGFSSGSDLNTIVTRSDVEGIWRTPLNENKKYNGGWAWVKNGDVTQCFIFLKNYFEQSAEITVPHLAEGEYILRLESNDLVVFPVVCADLISKENNSPVTRIVESLVESSSSNKRVLVTGSLLNEKSESGHWKAAIGDLLELSKSSDARLLLSNCVNPIPVHDEEIDKWRCLSGAYQHREGCKPPHAPLPNIRYVEDTKFSGLVLRNTQTGVSFGKLQWTNNSSQGLHAFSGCDQYKWNGGGFLHCDGLCVADELYRFLLRNKGSLLQSKIAMNNEAISLSNLKLEELLEKLSPASATHLRVVAGNVFQKCLKGVKAKQVALFCPEKLYTQSSSLDCAITTLVLIQHAIDAELMPEGNELEYGQLLSANKEHEILVWDSSEYPPKELYNMVREGIVLKSGSARPLTIIGRGNNSGMPPDDGRIRSNRLTDISNATPLNTRSSAAVDRDICEVNDRVVFWKNQGRIDEILASSDPAQDLVMSLRGEITVSEDL